MVAGSNTSVCSTYGAYVSFKALMNQCFISNDYQEPILQQIPYSFVTQTDLNKLMNIEWRGSPAFSEDLNHVVC